MKKLVYLLIAVSLMLALVPAAAFAHTEDDPQRVDLIAGGGNPKSAIDVGDVEVWNDGDTLYVKYVITKADWCITETHVQIATSPGGIPQKNGNPIPGQFDYKMTHDCVTEYTYEIPLEWDVDIELYIAAHAVVQKVIKAAPYYASTVVDFEQGPTKGGGSVILARSDPAQALELEQNKQHTDFFSLGFGGWIIVEFDCPIRNGEGNDVGVWEDTWGSYPPEYDDVYASQDGQTWTYLGRADNSNMNNNWTLSEFDLGELEWAKYIKIVDVTDATPHASGADAFDLNAVAALQDCIQEETAWGDGFDFPGKNWATYFTYIVQAPPPPQGEYTVTFDEATYDPVADTTTFTYTVTSGVPAISHWVLALGECHTVVSAGPGAWEVGTDPTTALYGIKWEEGFDDYETKVMYVTLRGNVPTGDEVRWAIKSAAWMDPIYGTVTGPTCP